MPQAPKVDEVEMSLFEKAKDYSLRIIIHALGTAHDGLWHLEASIGEYFEHKLKDASEDTLLCYVERVERTLEGIFVSPFTGKSKKAVVPKKLKEKLFLELVASAIRQAVYHQDPEQVPWMLEIDILRQMTGLRYKETTAAIYGALGPSYIDYDFVVPGHLKSDLEEHINSLIEERKAAAQPAQLFKYLMLHPITSPYDDPSELAKDHRNRLSEHYQQAIVGTDFVVIDETSTDSVEFGGGFSMSAHEPPQASSTAKEITDDHSAAECKLVATTASDGVVAAIAVDEEEYIIVNDDDVKDDEIWTNVFEDSGLVRAQQAKPDKTAADATTHALLREDLQLSQNSDSDPEAELRHDRKQCEEKGLVTQILDLARAGTKLTDGQKPKPDERRTPNDEGPSGETPRTRQTGSIKAWEEKNWSEHKVTEMMHIYESLQDDRYGYEQQCAPSRKPRRLEREINFENIRKKLAPALNKGARKRPRSPSPEKSQFTKKTKKERPRAPKTQRESRPHLDVTVPSKTSAEFQGSLITDASGPPETFPECTAFLSECKNFTLKALPEAHQLTPADKTKILEVSGIKELWLVVKMGGMSVSYKLDTTLQLNGIGSAATAITRAERVFKELLDVVLKFGKAYFEDDVSQTFEAVWKLLLKKDLPRKLHVILTAHTGSIVALLKSLRFNDVTYLRGRPIDVGKTEAEMGKISTLVSRMSAIMRKATANETTMETLQETVKALENAKLASDEDEDIVTLE